MIEALEVNKSLTKFFEDFLHRCFVLISFVVSVTAFLMGLGQFIGIAYLHVGPIQYVMRIYVIILCVLTIFNELEFTILTRDSALLKYWISRGLFYGFIGVLGLEENNVTPTAENSSAFGRTAALRFVKVVAWMMVSCGIIYFLMGLLCLQLVSNRLRQDYTQRVERSRETRRLQETYGNIGSDQNAV